MHQPLTVSEKQRLAELVAAGTPIAEICEVIGIWESYEFGRAIPILVMERLVGRQGVRSAEDVAAVLAALAAAAERGVLPFHGDLKMEHVFVSADG